MSNKIKKLSIKVEKGGMMCPRLGEIIQQTLTIKNNGQVWWTALRNLTEEERAKGFSYDGICIGNIKLSEYKNIGKDNALKILEKAQEVLPTKIDTEYKHFICDATPDEIYIEYENGERLFGQSIDFLSDSDDVENFYDYLAEELLIENLLIFGD